MIIGSGVVIGSGVTLTGDGPTGDPFFEYVSLLLDTSSTGGATNNTFLDSSANNFSITRNGNTTQGSFSPFGSNWSNYFDGSSDYLSIASSNIVNFGTGDFTAEAWVNLNVIDTSIDTIIGNYNNGSNGGFGWYINRGTNGGIQVYSGNSLIVSADSAVTARSWNHVAICRASGTSRIFVNGVIVASAADSSNYGADNSATGIGGTPPGSGALAPFPGYISNVRVVKGTALYTTAFTPSTTPLTAVSGTSLLTCQSNRFIDNSTNAFAITVNGSPYVQRFSPFVSSTSYSTETIGGSMYFDGSGDFLSAASNAAFDLGSSDFTIECFFNANSFAAGQGLISRYNFTTVAAGWALILNSATVIRFIRGNDVLLDATVAAMSVRSWNHVAVVRSGSTITTYLNGTQIAQATGVVNFSDATSALQVGRTNTVTNDMNGYISNVRVIKGTALYTSNFVPPTAPLTAITNTSLLLGSTNAGIFDAATQANYDTQGNAQVSTAIKKYGSGSIALDGDTDYVITPASLNFGYGTGDFTMEFWAYFNTVSADQTIVSNLTSVSSVNPHLYMSSTGTIRYYTNSADRITSSALSASTWYHIALCRASGSTRLFIDGIQNGVTYTDSNNYGTTAPLGVGTYLASGVPVAVQTLNGYVEDLRVTKGIGRYTGNFTPPTQSFPTF